MMRAETIGLNDEQWGSRPTRTSTDAALRKMMTFEYGGYMKATVAIFLNDQTACFDRMWPSVTNTVAAVEGCNSSVLECRAKTIDDMERSIKTGLGVSKQVYRNEPGKPKVKGEV